MKKLFKRMLALGLSLCLLLCVPVAASAEDEDLLSHYNGDDEEYYAFLWNYFHEIYQNEVYYDPDSFELMIECAVSREMANMFNATRSDFEHPYLRGTIDKNTGEITITGLRATGLDTEFYHVGDPVDHLWLFRGVQEIVIPDEINGHPVTRIQKEAFDGFTPGSNSLDLLQTHVQSVSIGDNVRIIGNAAFKCLYNLRSLRLGDNVQIVEDEAFYLTRLRAIISWGNSLRYIGKNAFSTTSYILIGMDSPLLPLPETVEHIGYSPFSGIEFPETYAVPKSVQTMDACAFRECDVKNLVIMNPDMAICGEGRLLEPFVPDVCLYCYAGSTTEAFAQKWGDAYQLIDGDSLLWDGKAVEENTLAFGVGMTEEELRSHLSVDGASSEIQIDGLQDGKVAGGTTITLFHTVAQAPGKVYTVEKMPEPVSVSVETLPTKTNYFYKETFDPSGLSLRVAYDDGTETVVTDGVACTGTDLAVGTNTITATYENCSTTFTVTVRYAWWQKLIRVFLFGFLWY